MKVLVTGASSGIGRDMAIYLSEMGYDIILVARDKKGLEETAKQIKTKTRIIPIDLSIENNCKELYNLVKDENIDILINNAGFGKFGDFKDIDLNQEINMIDLNIKTVHILTKLFLKDMMTRNSGYILNVASSAAFQAGPLMATYYATKAYVLRLTTAVYEELRRTKSKVGISTLCPGPVRTNFNKTANVEFELKSLSSAYVAKYGIDKMFKRKLIIIPGLYMKVACFLGRMYQLNYFLE
jgi:short-subunit dehydrogenase